jgi:hypothetical protein
MRAKRWLGPANGSARAMPPSRTAAKASTMTHETNCSQANHTTATRMVTTCSIPNWPEMSSRVGSRVGIGGGPDSHTSTAGTPTSSASRARPLSTRSASGRRGAGSGAGRKRSGPVGATSVRLLTRARLLTEGPLS